MNADEMKERRTAVSSLRSDLTKRLDEMDHDFLALLVQEANDRKKKGVEIAEDARIAVGEERAHRLKLAMEQRDYVDSKDREHAEVLVAFLMLPFWKRWVWIVFGGRGLQRFDIALVRVQLWWNR